MLESGPGALRSDPTSRHTSPSPHSPQPPHSRPPFRVRLHLCARAITPLAWRISSRKRQAASLRGNVRGRCRVTLEACMATCLDLCLKHQTRPVCPAWRTAPCAGPPFVIVAPTPRTSCAGCAVGSPVTALRDDSLSLRTSLGSSPSADAPSREHAFMFVATYGGCRRAIAHAVWPARPRLRRGC